MFKFKLAALLVSRHETFRFFSASSAVSLIDHVTQRQIHPQTEVDSDTQDGKSSESVTYRSLHAKIFVSSLLNCKNLYQVRQVHAQIVIDGMFQNLLVANKLLYMYVQYRAIDVAYILFDKMTERDAVSWSVIVGGFVKVGGYYNCFRTFREAIRYGLRLNNYILPIVLRACRDSMDLQMGRLVHLVVCKFGLSSDLFVSSALVDMYAKSRDIGEARKVFDKMSTRDLVTWTVMIGAYGECGNAKDSLVLFDQMRKQGAVPDKVAMVTVVYACARLGALHKAREIHDYIQCKNFSLDVILGTALIDMYSKCGSVDSAREIFEMMREKNVITWSAMIAAYGYHGLGQKALDLFPLMLRNGILPNDITFLSLLHACSHAGLVEEGLIIFYLMQDNYFVRPNVKHYTCVVDLLGRAGRLDEAEKWIEGMQIERDEGVWSSLLGACRVHGNLELAEKAAKSLLELQPQNSGHYILLSNIFAKAWRWGDVAKIRGLMTHRKLKKTPGWTWIEVDGKIHQFSVGDWSHTQSKEIYEMLKSLRPKLELAGYVPDTNFVLHDVEEEVKQQMLYSHSEKLAIAFGLIATPEGTPIRITKNLRFCGDCHTFSKLVSAITQRLIVVRDANRFHHFNEGRCSCGDYW
ncbi:hypothetical protein Ancab_031609 [Ancistrocladus abbreviatus]